MITPYLDILEAQAYFDGRLGSDAWDAATDSDRTKALTMATAAIDRLRFIGQKAEPDQSNEFPRLGQDSVPTDVKQAVCEMALQLLDDVDPNLEIISMAVTSDQFATIRSTFDRNFVLTHIRNGIPSSEAWALLVPYLCDPLNVKLIRSS